MIDYVLLQLNNVKKMQERVHEAYKSIAGNNPELTTMIENRLWQGEHYMAQVFKEVEAQLNSLRQAGEEGLLDIETLDAGEITRFARYLKKLAQAGVDRREVADLVHRQSYSAAVIGLEGYITSEEYQQKYSLSERHLRVNRMFCRVIPIIEVGTMIFVKDRPLTEGERLNLNSQTYLTLGEVAGLFKCDQTVAKSLLAACEVNPAMPTWAENYAKTTWYHGPDLERMKLWLESAERVDKKGHSLIRLEGLVWCEKCSKTWKTAPRNECDF